MFWKNKVITDDASIDKILSRGVITNILPNEEVFRKELKSGRRLRFYIGADPTSANLHLSHAKNYMLLEEFRSLGHEVVVLFGTFTARIGDPSGRASTRSQLNEDTIERNILSWKKQISPLIKFSGPNPARIEFNSSWLEELTSTEMVTLASQFTVQHMLERDMFEKRIGEGSPIFLNEFLYPLFQGYDSVALDTDVEIGGTDQTFNMLAGRTLLKKLKNKEKYVVVVNLMENPKTGELMSKSSGTGVFLDSDHHNMYGAILSLGDEMTEILLINNTRIPLDEIRELQRDLSPLELKHRAAESIVGIFFGEEEAKEARAAFTRTFSEKKTPETLNEIYASFGERLDDLLLKNKLVESKSDFKRLIEEGAISDTETEEKIKDPQFTIEKTTTLKIGKRRFARVHVQ